MYVYYNTIFLLDVCIEFKQYEIMYCMYVCIYYVSMYIIQYNDNTIQNTCIVCIYDFLFCFMYVYNKVQYVCIQ